MAVKIKLKQPAAFPQDLRDPHTGSPCGQDHGMTLRDYFAAKALPAVMRDHGGTEKEYLELTGEYCESIAFYSYQIADAMMEARKSDNLQPTT